MSAAEQPLDRRPMDDDVVRLLTTVPLPERRHGARRREQDRERNPSLVEDERPARRVDVAGDVPRIPVEARHAAHDEPCGARAADAAREHRLARRDEVGHLDRGAVEPRSRDEHGRGL